MRRNFLPRLLLTFFVLGIGVSAASAAVQNRITGAVTNSARTAIPNMVHGKARLATDLGPAPSNMKMEAMTLRFSMSAAQQAALDQLLIDQQNPSSPLYHQWLTPAQFGAQFGISSADLAAVTTWLTSQGFTITETANSSTFIRFNGTAAQVNAAFATSIHNVSLNGETHFANLTDPTIPTAFANVVLAITGLHDFRLKPRIRKAALADALHPDYTYQQTGAHYVVPGDFYKIYNELPLFTASTPINGTGQTIAVMGQVDISLADIAAFRSAAGLSVNAPTIQLAGADPGPALCPSNCSPNQGDQAESSLDVEWAGATAPGATIIFVNGVDVFNNSMTQAVNQNVAPILSTSYGDCEPAWGTAFLTSLNQLFKQANAQGQTVVAPGGDDGATDCDNSVISATQGFAVDFPASSPNVTGLGGTQFNEGSTTYWSASNTTITAGTPVPAAPVSAMSYIPEAAWNDAQYGYFGGGGGGLSNFFPKPYWQVGTGVPADASRDVPDISIGASDTHDGYIYCAINSCVNGFNGAIALQSYAGGTSFATPTFAGILALIEQKIGSRIGNANPTLYALANNSTYYVPGTNFLTNSSVVFNDVTTGNNNSPCTTGTYNCPTGGSIGYTAGSGYDLATGWGSVNVSNLATDWALVTAIQPSGPAGTNISTTVVSAPSTVAALSPVTLTATVSGTAGAVPTGTVQFLVNNAIVGSGTLSGTGTSSTATYSWATTCSTLGRQIVSASYSGDALYAGSKGAGITAIGFTTIANSVVTPVTIQVTSGTCPSFTIAGPTSSISVPANTTPTATITVAAVNGFTGVVTFTASAVSNTSYSPGFTFSPSTVTTSGTTTLTLTGITADLRMPAFPGQRDPGTSLAHQNSHRAPWYEAGSGATIAALLLFTLPRRRRLSALLVLALSIAVLGGETGCSAGNAAISGGSGGTNYAGTYLVTVTATYTGSSTITQNTTITFVVQ